MRKAMQFLVLVFLLLLILRPAFAEQYTYVPTELEFANLPDYCRWKFKPYDRATAERKGVAMFGGNIWIHMHHYCQGLLAIVRHYSASDMTVKSYQLSKAAGEFTYMIDRFTPGSAILAEAYYNRGRVLLMQGKEPDGVNDLQKVLEIDPNNKQTYFLLADQFEKWKKKDKALQIVSEGLRHIPSSKVLQQRYHELGGKLPYPEPLVAKVAEPEIAQQPETASAPTIQATSSTSASADSKQSKVPESNPPMGTPSNPYCRFCSD